MNTAVVDDVGFHHAIAISFHDLRKRPSEEVIAHVSEVQRLIGVRRRIFNHHERRRLRRLHEAIMVVGVNNFEQFHPFLRSHHEVKESLHHIEGSHSIRVFLKILSDFLCRFLWFLTRDAQKGESHEG